MKGEEEEPKFIVDGMLGKVARWLRILGYDAKYYNSLSDEELIKIAMEEGRILLTRDLNLHRRALTENLSSLLLDEKSKIDNLTKLVKELKIRVDIDVSLSRCPKCNSKLKAASKEAVASKVPEMSYKKFKEFWICPNCGQVYWQGSHWKDIYRTLKEIRAKTLSR